MKRLKFKSADQIAAIMNLITAPSAAAHMGGGYSTADVEKVLSIKATAKRAAAERAEGAAPVLLLEDADAEWLKGRLATQRWDAAFEDVPDLIDAVNNPETVHVSSVTPIVREKQ